MKWESSWFVVWVVALAFILTGSTVFATEVGDVIQFGKLSWKVLDIQDNRALLLSDKVIEERQYHRYISVVTWETCSLRQYLNGEFLTENFSDLEESQIAETIITNDDHPEGGNATNDKVFLLSIEEVVRYFPNDIESSSDDPAWAMNYRQSNAARTAVNADGDARWWWLRSPGVYWQTAVVGPDGGVYTGGRGVQDRRGGVRPALWLNLQP